MVIPHPTCPIFVTDRELPAWNPPPADARKTSSPRRAVAEIVRDVNVPRDEMERRVREIAKRNGRDNPVNVRHVAPTKRKEDRRKRPPVRDAATDAALGERAQRVIDKHRDVAGWTDTEIQHAARLLEAVDADEQRWAFGDGLLAREPMQPMSPRAQRRPPTRRAARGAHRMPARPAALTEDRRPRVAGGLPPRLRAVRVCRLWTTGGPAKAPQRLEQLRDLPRSRRGRVTTQAFQEWHRANVAPSRGGGPKRLPAVRVSPWLLFGLVALAAERQTITAA